MLRMLYGYGPVVVVKRLHCEIFRLKPDHDTRFVKTPPTAVRGGVTPSNSWVVNTPQPELSVLTNQLFGGMTGLPDPGVVVEFDVTFSKRSL